MPGLAGVPQSRDDGDCPTSLAFAHIIVGSSLEPDVDTGTKERPQALAGGAGQSNADRPLGQSVREPLDDLSRSRLVTG